MSVDFERAQQGQKDTPGLGMDENVSDAGTKDSRSPEQQKQDAELAERLSSIIEDANRRVVPIVKMIRQVSSSSSPLSTYIDQYFRTAAH